MKSAGKSAPPARKAAPAPPRRGRPKYLATQEGRNQVTLLVLADLDQDQIAEVMNISAPTLRKAYRRELDTTYARVKAEIAGKVVSQARAGNLKAAIYYLSTHGWVESERLVIADGGIDDSDIDSLSDAQIEARLVKLRSRAAARRSRS
jgi:hypothetical protein